MLSDGSLLTEALSKCTCASCGLVQHVDEPQDDNIRSYFGSSYSLGDRQPNLGFEGQRQAQYAEWILSSLGRFSPTSILELGCGNGALLTKLIARFPSAKVVGLESSERAVAWAQKCGLPVHRAYITEEHSMRGYSADLVLSVNVIEHTPNPAGFLKAAKMAVRDGGLLLVICPNGLEVGSELLIYDHLFTFCPSNLFALIQGCGLKLVQHQCSPPELPGFQMVLATVNVTGEHEFQKASVCAEVEVAKLHATRVSYLNAWKDLDSKLCDTIVGYRATVMFGLGEMAQLIRAYAPSVWDRIKYFVADDPVEVEYFGRPVISYAELKPAKDELVLLAVSPRSTEKLSARLKAGGHQVLTLDQFILPNI